MGWTTYNRPKGESDQAHFERELLTNPIYEIVECSSVDRVFYAAVRDKTTAEVWALVVLMRWMGGDHNFGYKDMSETMGPVVANAPAKVLDALSPTDNEYALEWRRRCRASLARRADARTRAKAVTVGVVIQLSYPLHFKNGKSASRFECVERTRYATRWDAITDHGERFRGRLGAKWAERYQWEIIPADAAASSAPS